MSAIYHGGGLDAAIAKYGGKRDAWLDLSTGINPNACPVGELDEASWQRLPDKSAEQAMLNAAREYYKVSPEKEIVAAPGTQAIIETLPQILDAKKATILSPTYGEHAHSWAKAGADVRVISSLDAVGEADVLVIVNPNNPTADVHSQVTLLEAAKRVKYLIVDEAFCDTMPEVSIVPDMPDNVVVLKSFGKFFGLAGLRLGFAVCHESLAEKFQSRLGPWAVSGPALEIGARAMRDGSWIAKTREALSENADTLAMMLDKTGFEISGINPLFIYVKYANAQAMFEHLCQHKILVRPFSDRQAYLRFGLCKDDAEFERLAKAINAYG